MWAPSVERGGGENGWADGLTGGALRAGPEPPTKTSGEICRLGQCRRREPRSFQQRRWPTLSWWGAVQWRTCSPPAGAAPRGGLRRWPRLSAVLGRPHGGSGERRHEGSHRSARTWGEVRRWWCQVRTPALVTLGVGWGLLRAGYRLRPGERLRGWKAWHGADGTPGPALNASPAARRTPEDCFYGFPAPLFLRSGVICA